MNVCLCVCMDMFKWHWKFCWNVQAVLWPSNCKSVIDCCFLRWLRYWSYGLQLNAATIFTAAVGQHRSTFSRRGNLGWPAPDRLSILLSALSTLWAFFFISVKERSEGPPTRFALLFNDYSRHQLFIYIDRKDLIATRWIPLLERGDWSLGDSKPL